MARRRLQPGTTTATGGEHATVDLVRRLGTLLTELGLTELEVTAGEVRVRLQRSVSVPAAPVLAPAVVHVDRPAAAHAAEIESASGVTIEAPMVGTFYRAPQPGAPPFVEEGDAVGPGQTLCILEAMKLMNEVKADVEGVIRAIHVENAQAVEFGQLLFELEPLAGRPAL